LRFQLIVIAAGFAAACNGATAAPAITSVARDIVLAAEAPALISARVSAGATLASVLRSEGVASGDVADICICR